MADSPSAPTVIIPVAPRPSAPSPLMSFLASGTLRRALALLLGMAVPLINARLGWNLDPAVIVGDMVLALGYITGSNVNEAVQAHADAKVQAALAAANPAPVLNS